MPTCHGCGNLGELVEEFKCHGCDRPGCGACAMNWKYLYNDRRTDRALCSPQCYNQWFWKHLPEYKNAQAKPAWADGMVADVVKWLDSCLPVAYERDGELQSAYQLYVQRGQQQDAQRVYATMQQQGAQATAQMIDQVRKSGRSVGLTCARCRGLNVVPPNAPPEAFYECRRCGARHDEQTVAGMLKQAMGPAR